jgi:hypothetical protein
MCLLLKTEFPHFLLNIIETQSIKPTIGNFVYQTNTTKKNLHVWSDYAHRWT